tara:strand:+ start:619 stop:837 length:219 start_codon:yes stop_codon:yes gene_type:complete
MIKTHQIVVLSREVWTDVSSSDAEIWTITDEGMKILCDDNCVPKNLEDKDVCQVQSLKEALIMNTGNLDVHL